VLSLSPGNANCPYGGAAFVTDAGTAYACNGAPGGQGPQGDAGAQGPAGFTLKVRDASNALVGYVVSLPADEPTYYSYSPINVTPMKLWTPAPGCILNWFQSGGRPLAETTSIASQALVYYSLPDCQTGSTLYAEGNYSLDCLSVTAFDSSSVPHYFLAAYQQPWSAPPLPIATVASVYLTQPSTDCLSNPIPAGCRNMSTCPPNGTTATGNFVPLVQGPELPDSAGLRWTAPTTVGVN
jgi:hypothetical protein